MVLDPFSPQALLLVTFVAKEALVRTHGVVISLDGKSGYAVALAEAGITAL
jgi:hypothetical protein